MNYRKYSRKVISFLPEDIRLNLLRKNINLDHNWPSDSLEIKIAETEAELEAAYMLLHDSYVQAGFMNPDDTGMRVLAQHLLPQTTTIIAKWNSRVIGTLSLIRDNPFGLPMEKVFNVDDRRAGGRRLGEVSSLAVHPDYRKQINTSLFPLFRFVMHYSRYYFGIDEALIAVNPSMVDLYLGALCFERLPGKSKSYDFVKGAPAVGLYLNFETCDERWRKLFSDKPDQHNFYKYWTNRNVDARCRLPQRQYHTASDPVLTPKLLSQFFLNKAQLSKKMSAREIKVLIDCYPTPEYQNILKPLYDSLSRKSVRLETYMKAKFEYGGDVFQVLNVSLDGLLIRTDRSLIEGDEAVIDVQLGDAVETRLKVAVCRAAGKNLLGLKILKSTDSWRMMIQALENEYFKKNNMHLKSVA